MPTTLIHHLSDSTTFALPASGNKWARMLTFFFLLTFTYLQGHTLASGKQAAPNAQSPVGYLTVYSATEQAGGTEPGGYYLHTGYRIYDSAGNVVKWVQNHDSDTDEDPAKIELKSGTYTIWAQADSGKYVSVPVVIKPARTTVLHLEKA